MGNLALKATAFKHYAILSLRINSSLGWFLSLKPLFLLYLQVPSQINIYNFPTWSLSRLLTQLADKEDSSPPVLSFLFCSGSKISVSRQ